MQTNPHLWCDEMAEETAYDEGIALTPLHWRIIRLMRTGFFETGSVPPLHVVAAEVGVPLTAFLDLFPGGPWRIAGLPRPEPRLPTADHLSVVVRDDVHRGLVLAEAARVEGLAVDVFLPARLRAGWLARRRAARRGLPPVDELVASLQAAGVRVHRSVEAPADGFVIHT